MSVIVIVFSIFRCSTTRPQFKRSSFAFSYEGKDYQIISTLQSSGEVYNVLLHYDGDTLTLRAFDNDQDGVLDTLHIADISLDKANSIYSEGISIAKAKGKYRKQEPSRTFVMSDFIKHYYLYTYIQGFDKAYNKFVIVDNVNNTKVRLRDNNADGILDENETDSSEPKKYQRYYKMVIERGMDKGRIEIMNNMILVKLH